MLPITSLLWTCRVLNLSQTGISLLMAQLSQKRKRILWRSRYTKPCRHLSSHLHSFNITKEPSIKPSHVNTSICQSKSSESWQQIMFCHSIHRAHNWNMVGYKHKSWEKFNSCKILFTIRLHGERFVVNVFWLSASPLSLPPSTGVVVVPSHQRLKLFVFFSPSSEHIQTSFKISMRIY